MSTGFSKDEHIMDKYKSLFSQADDRILREIICFNTNLLHERSKIKVCNPETLLDQFKVVPDVLSAFRSAQTSSNSAGTLLVDEIEKPDTSQFMAGLLGEVKSMNLHQDNLTAKSKVATQWVVRNPSDTNLPSVDMSNYKHINQLCDMLSNHRDCVGDFNSCIVNYYSDGSARTRAHADDESYIDQDSSIACFSLEQNRDIAIFEKHSNKHIGKFTLENGSLFIMNPGAQSNTKHQVMSGVTSSGERYSLSFRKIKYGQIRNEWPFNSNSHSSKPATNKSPPIVETTLVLGTSIAHWLDYDKLSGNSGRSNVVNLCKRGGKIFHLQDMLDDHYTKTSTSEQLSVRRVIVSVGTNDLRNNRKSTVGHLYTPMENLIVKIRTYYPNAIIHVQSLLPQRVQNAWTVSNVQGFNKLLIRLCAANRCNYIDIFRDFLGINRHPDPKLYRWDGVHLSTAGLGILARAFISKIRGRFNPFNDMSR